MANGLWFRNRSGRHEVWIVYKDEQGVKHRDKIGPDEPRFRLLAKEALLDRRHKAQTLRFFPERKVLDFTFLEGAQKYWDLILHKKDKSWSYRLAELKEVFGDMRLVDIKVDLIQRWYNDKVEATSAGTANRTLSLLRAIFNRAVVWDMYSAANPVRKVDAEQDPPSRERFLSFAEMKVLFAVCDPRLLPIILFALLTGLRKTEALMFRWESVDLDRHEIKAKRLKKGIYPEIPVAPKLHHLLLCLGPRPSGRLFDISAMTFRRLWDKARRDSGLPHFTWHDLRRTFGSHFTMITKDLPVLTRLLGHNAPEMVVPYSRLLNEHVRTQMEAFDAGMPELPAPLRDAVPRQLGYQPGRQPVTEGVPGSV